MVAYITVDKHWRLMSGQKWFSSEQLTEDERKTILKKAVELGSVDAVLSHTCPMRYQPTEWFLDIIDQSLVENTMEKWLDEVDDALECKKWYCGHFHGEKIEGYMRFMFQTVERFME